MYTDLKSQDFLTILKLIRSANPQSRPVGIIAFAHVVRPSPLFKSSKTKQQKTMVTTGVTVSLAKWIIDDTCLVLYIFIKNISHLRRRYQQPCKHQMTLQELFKHLKGFKIRSIAGAFMKLNTCIFLCFNHVKC